MCPNFQRGAREEHQGAVRIAHNCTSLRANASVNKDVCEKNRGPYLVRPFGGMVLWATILFLQGAGFVGEFHFILYYRLV